MVTKRSLPSRYQDLGVTGRAHYAPILVKAPGWRFYQNEDAPRSADRTLWTLAGNLMLQTKSESISPQEYLAMERTAPTKNEFYQGEVYAMAGASREHNLISTNIVRVLGNGLLNQPCSVYSSDMRLGFRELEKYTYPDIAVVCGDEEFEDEQRDVLLNPLVIIEILSPSTEAYDRGLKFAHYQTIQSLHEYILVAQDQYRVERFLRQTDNSWLYEELHDLAGVINITSLGWELPLREVYRRLSLD